MFGRRRKSTKKSELFLAASPAQLLPTDEAVGEDVGAAPDDDPAFTLAAPSLQDALAGPIQRIKVHNAHLCRDCLHKRSPLCRRSIL